MFIFIPGAWPATLTTIYTSPCRPEPEKALRGQTPLLLRSLPLDSQPVLK